MRKILAYPSNYNVLVQYRDYMRNYQDFFTKDYNAIDKQTDKKITKLIELITNFLNNWYDEIPDTRSDNPTLYNVQ
jgi:DNA phosphorothioation-dependent restriction protein DptG